MGSMDNIPQELFLNILSMLPARELMKCKCVCKSWFNFITDPHFISNYYVFHNNKNSFDIQEEHLLISRTSSRRSLEACVSFLSGNNNESEEIFSCEALYSFDKYKYQRIYWCQIMGPCNGIYFLKGSPSVMINPSIRQFKPLIGLHDTYSLGKYPGFGFDPITNDYKVIVLNYILVNETNERKVIAELYSLNFNSWRKLDDAVLPLPFRIGGSYGAYTYVQNCFHWWGYVEESATKDDIVLSFDMVTELFRKIKLPKICSSSREYFTTLAPFDNSTTIGAIVYHWRGTEKIFDIWVMKDYWNEGSWMKQYSVGPVHGLYEFVGFYRNNQFLWKDNSRRLVLYELDSEHTRRLKVYGRDRHVFGRPDSIRGARYMESLVSLHR